MNKPTPVQSLTSTELFKAHCKSQSLWGLFVCPAGEDISEVLQSCPLLEWPKDAQSLFDGQHFFFYDTERDMRDAYDFVVGDDGPTELNPYDGPARTYAMTCDPDGQLLTENT